MNENNIPVVNLNEEETCVDCHKGLGYPKSTHIALRPYYVEVNGDRCKECFESIPVPK